MKYSRRSFLRTSAVAAGAISTARFLYAPNLLAADSALRRANCVQIGCGGRGMNHLDAMLMNSKENLVAIVDPDEKRHEIVKRWLGTKQLSSDKLKVYTDYRKMFDEIGKEIDAVFIASPNHQHALPSMLAMDLGKAVFCEKPLTHTIAEARKLREMAAACKAPTQMGNQGHCEDGYRRLCEFIWAGTIGKIQETYSWTDRANGGVGPRPPYKPAPEGLHWEEWIGPSPYRNFHDDLHPHEWHGWYDFGNGSIGNMGCHVLDGVYWALKLEHPLSVECEEIRGGSDERYPTGCRFRWDFAARGDMPAVKVYWYEGLNSKTTEGAKGDVRSAKGAARNLPPLFAELLKEYPDEEFDSNGTFYVGDKGIIYTSTYGSRMHVLPLAETQDLGRSIPKTLPRPKNVMVDFLEAVRAGKKETAASFDYGARLTEFTLIGNLAQHAGTGKKLIWDGPGMKVVNETDLNKWVSVAPRKGWS
jgi:predicted dehydrogenase